MNTANLKASDNVEVYKQKTVISCENMVTVAQNASNNHPQIKKVILMEHAPRHDTKESDPTGLKQRLVIFANETLKQIIESRNMKGSIVLGKHNLQFQMNQIDTMYKDDWSGHFDGVHLYKRQGKIAYT